MTIKQIKTWAIDIHRNAVDKGFWEGGRNFKEANMLIITELSEAIEAHRESKRADITGFNIYEPGFWTNFVRFLKFDPVHRSEMEYKEAFEKNIKDTLEDELADAYIRILDLLHYRYGENIDILFTNQNDVFRASDVIKDNFAESVYIICSHIAKDNLFVSLLMIETLANKMGVNLGWHVDKKMKFNSYREKLHGKKY